MASIHSLAAAVCLSMLLCGASAATSAADASPDDGPRVDAATLADGATKATASCDSAEIRQQSTALRKSLLRSQRQLDQIHGILDRVQAAGALSESDRDAFYGVAQALTRALRALRVDGSQFNGRAESCVPARRLVASTLATLEQSERAIRKLHLEMILGDAGTETIDVALQAATQGAAALKGAQEALLSGRFASASTLATMPDGGSAATATAQ